MSNKKYPRKATTKLEIKMVHRSSSNPERSDAVVVSIFDSYRHKSIALTIDDAECLIHYCKSALQYDQIYFAHQNVLKSIPEKAHFACDMMFNYICNNPIPVMEQFYVHLKNIADGTETYEPDEDDMDTEIYCNAFYVIKYYNCLYKQMRRLDDGKASFTVYEAYEVLQDQKYTKNGSTFAPVRKLTIDYQPYYDSGETKAKPWLVQINEKECLLDNSEPTWYYTSSEPVRISLSQAKFDETINQIRSNIDSSAPEID